MTTETGVSARWARLWLVACLLSAPVAQAREADGVGVVAEYRPAAARFALARSGAPPVPVRIGTVVMAGDRLDLPAGGAVVIQHGDGQRREFAGPGRFDVPAAAPLGKLASVFRSISAVFDDEYRMAGTAASRSGEDCGAASGEVRPIVVPMLAGQPAIAAGVRDLPLTWIGGCTPFTVSLRAADGRTLYRESVEGRQVRLDDVALVAGRYEVLVEDASGLSFRGGVEAVSAAPALPADLAADTSPLGIVAGAVWLASQDAGRWRFDSFERLRPLIRAGDPLAGAIGDGVLWGELRP